MTRKARTNYSHSRRRLQILNAPFVGNLTFFFRVYSGTYDSGDHVYVPAKDASERLIRAASCNARHDPFRNQELHDRRTIRRCRRPQGLVFTTGDTLS